MAEQRGIQSVEVGGRLLQALAHTGRPMPLKELALAAEMAPAKAHPYLVSFGKLGLIAQDAASGHYGLGPLAMQLGLISLQQVDPLRLATARLPDLALALQQTVAIAVWGQHGATIVRIEEAPSLVHMAMRHGAVMGTRSTASGRLFAAHLPRAAVLAAEPGLRFDAAFQAELARVREQGLASVDGLAVAGVCALAAPVFDGTGALRLALTAIGPSGSFDVAPGGPAAQQLCGVAAALSAQLGYRAA